MLYILLTIIFNVILAMVFRLYKDYGVQNLPAIVVNYIVCTLIASWMADRLPWQAIQTQPPWLMQACLIGTLFIGGFLIVAYTIQYYGVGVTAVFQKVSLVLTAFFAIWYFSESFTMAKIVGIPLALLSIALIQLRGDKLLGRSVKRHWWILLLPLLTFSFNGVIDTLLFFVERTGRAQAGDFHFIAFVFATAGVVGLLYFAWQMIRHKRRIHWVDIIGGIALGIPNFFSIHFFLKALASGYGGSVVVPINNVGIILLSSVVGYFLFRERFTSANAAGLAIAVLSIILLSIS
ncbi:MAG: DMT family transporter [Saprospiraceae bacterium]|nr:DMT family transporter [Saprospiraceae bacterium]